MRNVTIGVGGSSRDRELSRLTSIRGEAKAIAVEEYQSRVAKAQGLMRRHGIDALYLDASTSLAYFTGARFWASERLHGALIPARGDPVYVVPAFEEAKTRTMLLFGNDVRVWEEHEDPCALVIETLRSLGHASGTVGIDEMTPFFTFDGLRRAGNSYDFVNGSLISAPCRRCKSNAEIALLQTAKNITLRAHQAAAACLEPGITTTQVAEFLAEAHRRLGCDGALSFCIVLFGEPTAYPHGVPYPQTLSEGDMVLIDVGATVEGYHSDITRSYVYGEPTPRQREVWNVEKAAQQAAFAAAQLGVECEMIDAAARRIIEQAGFGPGYALPGLPHRTGHGIGLDVHEWSYLVKGDKTPLAPGMCFSNEPMICLYGEFGVRLEDHFYMTEDGPRWFTEPSYSIDDPFGLQRT